MRGLLVLGACVALAGCSTLGGSGMTGEQLAAAIDKIATDPNCGHTDTLNVSLGAVSTGTILLQRSCPGPATAVSK